MAERDEERLVAFVDRVAVAPCTRDGLLGLAGRERDRARRGDEVGGRRRLAGSVVQSTVTAWPSGRDSVTGMSTAVVPLLPSTTVAAPGYERRRRRSRASRARTARRVPTVCSPRSRRARTAARAGADAGADEQRAVDDGRAGRDAGEGARLRRRCGRRASAPFVASYMRRCGVTTLPTITTPGTALVGPKLASPARPVAPVFCQTIAPVSRSSAWTVGCCGVATSSPGAVDEVDAPRALVDRRSADDAAGRAAGHSFVRQYGQARRIGVVPRDAVAHVRRRRGRARSTCRPCSPMPRTSRVSPPTSMLKRFGVAPNARSALSTSRGRHRHAGVPSVCSATIASS